jgi:ferredoxin
MGVAAEKWEDNAAGSWYVDKSCSQCNLCTDIAPEYFGESEAGDHVKVLKQPETPEQVEDCQDAMDQCPCEAIGNDA